MKRLEGRGAKAFKFKKMKFSTSIASVILLLLGCGPTVGQNKNDSEQGGGLPRTRAGQDVLHLDAQSQDGPRAKGGSVDREEHAAKKKIPFVLDLAQRARMRERYCNQPGYECKSSGWPVPGITKELGADERAVDGIPREMHSYETNEGWLLVSYARVGQPVTAWEVHIRSQRERYAIFDMDCDGIFEVKSHKGFTFVTLPCEELD